MPSILRPGAKRKDLEALQKRLEELGLDLKPARGRHKGVKDQAGARLVTKTELDIALGSMQCRCQQPAPAARSPALTSHPPQARQGKFDMKPLPKPPQSRFPAPEPALGSLS